ncbi:MAG: dephospho-CoA kinase [Muribaculaceae bacterium]|nr:dephospho-CoA kinase [Muribaculaceae bacterium]
MAEVIAINGGIGSGKSLISNILRNMGYNVYDCDSNAKEIMDNSKVIKDYIKTNIYSDAIYNNQIDRLALSRVVFNNNTLLYKLNSIVHSEVRNDILIWINKYKTATKLFIETAILYQSGIDKLVDKVWEIHAPEETRIKRVIKRNNISRGEIISRINAQKQTLNQGAHQNTHQIINDDIHAILPQIIELL